jgi:hypothetical protein
MLYALFMKLRALRTISVHQTELGVSDTPTKATVEEKGEDSPLQALLQWG